MLTSHTAEDTPVLQEEADQLHLVSWSRYLSDFVGIVKSLGRIKQLVQQFQYDIVHVHTPIAAFIVRMALAGKSRKTIVVYTAHGFHFHPRGQRVKNYLFLTLEKIAGRWTDYLIVINKHDFAAALKHKIVPADRIVYMPGIGVDVDCLTRRTNHSNRANIRQDFGIPPSDFVFLVIAEINANKSHTDVIHAFSQLQNQNAWLLIAGDGPLLYEMKHLASKLEIDDRVLFLGIRADIPELIVFSDAVILASAREGLPRSVMEAMALNRCVIGSDIRGTRDLLEGECGLMFPHGDQRELCRLMHLVISNNALKISLERNAFQKIRSYDIARIIELHDRLYSSIGFNCMAAETRHLQSH